MQALVAGETRRELVLGGQVLETRLVDFVSQFEQLTLALDRQLRVINRFII